MEDYLVTSVDPTLDDLVLRGELEDAHKHSFEILMHSHRNLQIFEALASKSVDEDQSLKSFLESIKDVDQSVKSFLESIKDVVTKNDAKIYPYSVSARKVQSQGRPSLEGGLPVDLASKVDQFRDDIESFAKGIDAWYIVLCDSSRKSASSSSGTDEEVTGIIASLLENLADFLHLRGTTVEGSAVEALREKLSLLKNFIRFTKAQGVRQPQFQDLVAHVEFVAVNAAHISHTTCRFEMGDEEWQKGMQLKMSQLIEKMKPSDPQAYKAYTEVLKLKGQSCDHSPDMKNDGDDSLTILKDFVESLVYYLWEMLQMDTCLSFAVRDQLFILYEGLKFLRIILRKRHIKFNNEVRDLTEAAVCDAGIIIFSSSQEDFQIERWILDLQEKICHIGTKVGEEFDFPRTNELLFVDFVLETLMKVISYAPDSDAKSRLLTIHEDLDIPDSFVTSSDSIIEYIQNIKADALKISDRQKGTLQKKDQVVGFIDEEQLIFHRLTSGPKRLQKVAILGPPGIGKTTLATKVYDDRRLVYHFPVRAAASISPVFDEKVVLLQLLRDFMELSDENSEMISKEDLATQLRKKLKGNKYLIFLDNVWDIQAWRQLEIVFPDDDNGSRILWTSRTQGVIPCVHQEEPLFLRPRTRDESWELMQSKLFPESNCPPELCELGQKIAESCEGFPSTVTFVAGHLTTMKPEHWERVRESLTSGSIYTKGQCKSRLELSYADLPEYLKPCFLYFGLFPAKEEVSARRMIQLWIAEGFVRETTAIEDEAMYYLRELVARSLVVGTKMTSTGGIKVCSVLTGLIRDFCVTKAQEENFFRLLRGDDEVFTFNDVRNLRRLCIHSEPKHFKESRLLCPRVRSLLFFDDVQCFRRGLDISFIIHSFKLLRVMAIVQINLGPVFPSEIKFLFQLRYLAVRGEMEAIPPSIGNLSRLRTLVVDSLKTKVSLPDTLWNMRRLRHLYIRNAQNFAGFSLPLASLDDSPRLDELHAFSGAIIMCGHSMGRMMRKFPKISKLKCRLFGEPDGEHKCKETLTLDFPCGLESLDVSSSELARHPNEYEFCFPQYLKKLTISGFGLPWSKISGIGELRCLEVLKLLNGSFVGETWDMQNEQQFCELVFLKLESLDIVRWTGDDDFLLPKLKRLVLQSCCNLKVIPNCLAHIPTLEMIEVSSCSNSIASSVRGVQVDQVECSNSDFKIRISDVLGESS